jgi:hypothetical protein
MENSTQKNSSATRSIFGIASSFIATSLTVLFLIYVGSLVISYVFFFDPSLPPPAIVWSLYIIIMIASFRKWVDAGETFSWKRIHEDSQRR